METTISGLGFRPQTSGIKWKRQWKKDMNPYRCVERFETLCHGSEIRSVPFKLTRILGVNIFGISVQKHYRRIETDVFWSVFTGY